jgi:glyoxylase-like metal-dependent hydrolase (beta-lactamase superfamily II)
MHPEPGPVNAYLFTEPEVVLVDTGPNHPGAWSALVDGLAEHGVAVRDIRRVVITHPHHDHYAQAGRIAAESGAAVWIADVGAPWLLDAAGQRARRLAYYRDEFLPGIGASPAVAARVLAGMEAMYATIGPVPSAQVVTFAAGSTLALGGASWRVLHLPGHASAQSCFYQPESRSFLAGDMLLRVTPTPVVDAPPPGAARVPCLPQFLDSLARVEALAIDAVYPGHGPPFGDPRQIIAEQRARIQQRQEECFNHIAAGRRTICELFPAMYGDRASEGNFMPAVWMLLGYTDLLQAEGRVAVEEIGGVWYYRTA